jgi:hypothetical protein
MPEACARACITPHAGTRCSQSNAGAPRARTPARAAAPQLCAGPAMALFRPEELEQLVCGRSELDFAALQRAAAYENGYSPDSPARSQIGLGLLMSPVLRCTRGRAEDSPAMRPA